jgi:hypothetical protein
MERCSGLKINLLGFGEMPGVVEVRVILAVAEWSAEMDHNRNVQARTEQNRTGRLSKLGDHLTTIHPKIVIHERPFQSARAIYGCLEFQK